MTEINLLLTIEFGLYKETTAIALYLIEAGWPLERGPIAFESIFERGTNEIDLFLAIKRGVMEEPTSTAPQLV